jgi:CheY-like chemotaxis protein
MRQLVGRRDRRPVNLRVVHTGLLSGSATRALLQDPRTVGIAIVAHTALDEAEVRRHLTGHEFDGYVQKGRPHGQLVALITTLVG